MPLTRRPSLSAISGPPNMPASSLLSSPRLPMLDTSARADPVASVRLGVGVM
jgi:hypothetical protein